MGNLSCLALWMRAGLGCGADAYDDDLEVPLAGQNVRSFLISLLVFIPSWSVAMNILL